MSKEYIIYCDESEESGQYFGNFYGGALVCSEHLDEVKSLIAAKKAELNLFGEVKWSKITENYAEKYIAMMDLFFDLIRDGKIKVRIMFTQKMKSISFYTTNSLNMPSAYIVPQSYPAASRSAFIPISYLTPLRRWPNSARFSSDFPEPQSSD
jgi:hypothetical protein